MQPIRRKRAFLPKVKTGCGTCKVRKVKCDEAKPKCNRCLSTGRKCDGYRPASDTPPPGSNSLASLDAHPNFFASQAERRSFDFFQSRACHRLGGYFNRPFWTQEVLRAATHHPSIRHLVFALGTAYETFENEVSSSDSQYDTTGGKHFALLQANQSIRLMKDLFHSGSKCQSVENTSCIVTASILFTYIASLQGQFAQAIEHVRSGLKVLQDFDASSPLQGVYPSAYPVSLDVLRRALISIYGQVRCMINDEALTQWHRDLLISDLEPVVWFPSITEADLYVEKLFYNMLAFRQNSEFNPPRTPEEHDVFDRRRKGIMRALDRCKEAVDLLAAIQPLTPGGRRDDNGITILHIYLTIIEMRMGMDALQPEQREATFDRLEPYLERILGYCERIVIADRQDSLQASCYSGLGIVMPLHTVAARCRNPRIRRKALDLLLSGARRECLWDGTMTGHIATNTYNIEEQAANEENPGPLADGRRTVPDEKRVREVKITFVGDRKAHAQYVTVGNWKRKERGIQHVVEW
ncbi:hypothetical protein LTR72_004362 [Exophiala xenobiotica]|nr:hypothetical protein LTR72_004362 [Exophiala xenobiotica]KAK5293664.1 hypothetical protein LTR14_004555 [Exophiala xenobiotica]KAK5496717.1 hypothetical protein LTR55_001207 [Exophiala xenobiotica]